MPPTQKQEKQPTYYTDDSQVLANTAAQFMDTHPELLTARILYFWRSKATKKGGKPVPGTAKKVSVSEQFLMRMAANQPDWEDPIFKIEVAFDVWNGFADYQRRALMDQLLEKCTGEEGEDGSMKWSLRDPDVHEFARILSSHGTWLPELDNFCQVARDISEDPVEGERAVTETVTVSSSIEVD